MKDGKINQLTFDELTLFIEQVVEQKLSQLQPPQKLIDKQQLETLFTSIDSHLWTPPANIPSTLELLRQDRDQ